jgi:hypothetical protein
VYKRKKSRKSKRKKFNNSSKKMKNKKTILMLLVLVTGLTLQQSAKAQEAQMVVPNSVLGNGGAVLNDNQYRIGGTLGQPFIGVTQNPSNVNSVGFWYLQSHMLSTDVEQMTSNVLKRYRLQQNYPNPFNSTTTIQFTLPKRLAVTLKLYDILGGEVATLVDEELEPGEYKVTFEAGGLPSGVYFYRIQAKGFVQTRKLTLLH